MARWRTSRPQRNRRAFTLVELLVVVAIIAVLVSMLLPAMRRVWEQARSVQCQSNIRQVGLALNLYANAHDGVIPAPSHYKRSSTGTQLRYWHSMLQGNYDCATYIRPAAGNKTSPLLYCTNNGQMRGRIGTYAMYIPTLRFAVPREPSSIVLPTPTAPYPPDPGIVSFEGINLARIRQSANFLLIGDSSIEEPGHANFDPDEGSPNFQSFSYKNNGGTFYSGLWASHRNMVNALFADGHVESCDKGRLLSCSNINGNTTPTVRARGISWWRNQDFTVSNY